MDIVRLDNQALLEQADSLAKAVRTATADLLACLGEIQRRELHLQLGHNGIFDYCVTRLGFSEGAAGRRVCALRAIARSPEVIAHLRDGSLHLGAICRLEPFLRRDTGAVVLSRAVGLNRRGLDELVAELESQTRAVVPVAPIQGEPRLPELFPMNAGLGEQSPTAPATPHTSSTQDRVSVPSPGKVRFSFEASTRLRDKLERIGNLMAFKLKTRRLEELVEALADEMLSRHDGRTLTRAPREVYAKSRRVPLLIRREVRRRDGDRCVFVAEDGTRCSAVRLLQYDHIRPWALGGRSDDPGNIRLLCRAHNLHLARKLFPAARRAAERAVVSPPAR